MTLPIKKYIDTKYKTSDSISSSNFKINLPQSLKCPDNSVFYIDDVSIPNAWYVIEQGINDTFYISIASNNTLVNNFYTIQIDPGNYTGADFAEELHNKCSIIINNIPAAEGGHFFTITHNYKQKSIFFDCEHSVYKFRILTPDDLKQSNIHDRYSNSYDINNPKDFNEIIGNLEGYSVFHQFPTAYETKTLNLQTIRNLYLHSSMGNYNSLTVSGESSIIKKIPVNANKNGYIFDNIMTGNDFGDCSNQTLRTINFDLKDSRGNHINLHGNNWSFSIIFSRMEKYIVFYYVIFTTYYL